MAQNKSKIMLVEGILDMELDMFLSVNASNKAHCQDHPDQFKLHRRAQFNTWSENTLESYLSDLRDAKATGKNLMTFKYARMQDLIPDTSPDPLIEKMVAIQTTWQQEMCHQYPLMMSKARPVESSNADQDETAFATYLKGELESYSIRTRHLLYRDMQDKLKNGVNMAHQIYDGVVKAMGYRSIASVEEQLKNKGSDPAQ